MLDERQNRRLTRSYELVAQLRALRHSDRSVMSQLMRAIVLRFEYQFLPHYFGAVPRWRLVLRRLRFQQRVTPDFVITGPIKGGSSDLAVHLMMHPNVMPPLAKEVPSVQPRSWRPYYPSAQEMARARRRLGRVRTPYCGPFMYSMRLIDNLRVAVPEAKVIIMLRDPVDRAFSHWKWEVLWAGNEAKSTAYFQSFAEYVSMALDLFPEFPMDSRSGHPLLGTGIYHKAVQLWLDRFGRENVMVIDSGRYFDDRGSVLTDISRFLDLPDFATPEHPRPINRNPLAFEPPDDPSRRALSDFYRPFNAKLYDLVGCDYGWG